MPIRLTKAVKALLLISFALFIVQQTGDRFFGTHLLNELALNPRIVSGHIWQILTYGFVQGDVMQLFFNLMMLALVGSELELVWGSVQFVRYYFFCTVSTALIYILIQNFAQGSVGALPSLVGASSGIYGLLVAYGLIFGDRVMLFMMLFPMKAKHFVCVLALIELLTTFYSSGGAWASAAQLGGMAAGFGFLWTRAYWAVQRRKSGSNFGLNPKRRKKKRSQHLKLIVNNDSESDLSEGDSSENPKTWH